MPIAECRFFADPGTGTRVAVSVSIHAPRHRKRSVSCRVSMSGIAKPCLVVGENSMQAVALSVRLINNTLAVRHRQGWRFYYSKSDRRSFAIWRVWGHSPRLSAFAIPGEASRAAAA